MNNVFAVLEIMYIFAAQFRTDYLLGGSLVLKNGKIDKYLFEGGYAQATSTGAYTDSFAFNYYNQDHLGNNREVVDASGSIVQVTNYYPFGTPYADASASQNPKRHALSTSYGVKVLRK